MLLESFILVSMDTVQSKEEFYFAYMNKIPIKFWWSNTRP